MRLELVDPSEPLLASGWRRNHLPGGHTARSITHDDGAVTDQEGHGRDGRPRLARDGDGLDALGVVSITQVVVEDLPSRSTEEEIVAAGVEPHRGDLTLDRRLERPQRFLPSCRADQC